MTKEEVYDEKIHPLMAQVIAICKEHKIAMIGNFRLDDNLACTTFLLGDEYGPSDGQLAALKLLRPQSAPVIALAETHETLPDGTKRITIKRIS